MNEWWVFPFAAGVALLLTGALRRYALFRGLMDSPNERSSHTVPTPRGGGLAIVLTCLVALPLLNWAGGPTAASLWALVGAGAWVALVGWFDDHGHIPARWRLLAHFVAAGWALAWLGGLPPLPAFGLDVDLGWLGYGLAAFYLVWLLNLYNFMDGIDGIAGIEALTVCLGGVILYLLSPATGAEWAPPTLLLATVFGFLFWNFPKAKIFMGDAGSGFVGIMLGVLSIQAAWVAPELFWGWVILLGAFVVDATVTLVRRVLRDEPFHRAHCSHAYQYAARKFGSHPPVSYAFGAINLFWLLPVASTVALGWLDGALGVVIAYLPLVGLALWFKAGAAELQ
ncbi:MraY family glycosyltransferase [Thiohalomonas denitrificans]|uniref:Fuc2NAc and GlcNAc transferase n=1 Tax=Thiohalomonas denitrificans TaxID=415747 RepID=A0A1G5QZE1_9GAMM|nr:glycosyltransferase family 4 protein [Thiohalomonas denitrificans]SCZ67215.1 Fuc2NAc and GlcNAc transferase [Thiohalomonas denitrificans]